MASFTTMIGAYGSGRTTGTFDPLHYAKKPEVIFRLFGLVFSIIVFSCIADKGYSAYYYNGYYYGYYYGSCGYNYNVDACNFGIAVGVISLVGLIVLLVLDGVVDVLSNVQQRKYLVISDICFSCGWGFMWLVCFCFLTDQWRVYPVSRYPDTLRAAIAFSFFSLLVFICLSVLAILRLRNGIVLSANSTTAYEASAPPPPYAPSVYGAGDLEFSPQPFGTGSAERNFPMNNDAPAY